MPPTDPSPRPPAPSHSLELRVLGPVELVTGGEPIALPRSKKCRALLAYLAVTGRAHRRDQLCDLLWDVADDPKGALRWTLSRLRSVMPDGSDPLETDRDTVRFRTEGVRIDARELSTLKGARLSELPSEELERVAALHRGELLEGLELPDFLEFSAWCVSQREEHRRLHCAVLGELVRRAGDRPDVALPWARRLVQVDPVDVGAHTGLLRHLLAVGFTEEAERRHAHTMRQLRQLAAPEADQLDRAFKALRARAERRDTPEARTPVLPSRTPWPRVESVPGPFVGRARPLQHIRDALSDARSTGNLRAVLVTAEPGGGKTRLLERVVSEAQNDGFAVLAARAFDLARGRPFGPWLDALGVSADELVAPAQSGGRPRVLERIATLVRDRTGDEPRALLVFDDVQWLDPDSAEALFHLLHGYQGGPLVALLSARAGELPDNPAVTRGLATLARDRAVLEVELEPLGEADVATLTGTARGPGLRDIMRASAGNPLYALELARGAREGHPGAPPTLVQLLRERVGRLSDSARDALRWAAVLGFAFDAARLEALSDLSQGELVDALEELERHALLRIDVARNRQRYTFSHDVVREAVYGELSHPRRRLMHRKVAHLLQDRVDDPATAHEVARHASLAGEDDLGVRACVAAGRHALRTCANADAEALAKRGLHHAVDLAESARVPASLDLLHVLYSARAPDRKEAAERVRDLAERALDLGLTKAARVGFQMLSYLRWESSSLAAAHENILQAERVSRSADPEERSQALAHAARCLVLLERNLGQAEAFALEASGVAARSGRGSAAVAFALAMIAAHRGETDAAASTFAEAQDLARAAGERLAEFAALEHRLMLAIDAERDDEARALSDALVDLGGRVRPGAEVAIARALHALCRADGGSGDATLESAVASLRAADAKYELSFVLTRRALRLLAAGAAVESERMARDALDVARAIGRASEVVIATTVLAEVQRLRGRPAAAAAHLADTTRTIETDLSSTARAALRRARGAPPT